MPETPIENQPMPFDYVEVVYRCSYPGCEFDKVWDIRNQDGALEHVEEYHIKICTFCQKLCDTRTKTRGIIPIPPILRANFVCCSCHQKEKENWCGKCLEREES